MTHDWNGVLCEVIRIVYRAKADLPRGWQDVLVLLKKNIDLENAALLLAENSAGPDAQVVPASGPAAVLFPEEWRPSPEPEALRSPGIAVCQGRQIQCAAGETGHFTILCLTLPESSPFPPEFTEFIEALALVLHGLANRWRFNGGNRRQDDGLSFLAELSHKVHQARTMSKILQVVCVLVQSRFHVAGVFLRPLFEKVEGAPAVFHIGAPWRHLSDAMQDLEERLAARFREKSGVFSPSGSIESDILAKWQGPPVRILPLALREGGLWGTLTIFGDFAWQDEASSLSGRPKLLEAITPLIVQAMERMAVQEKIETLSADNSRKLEETSLLYRISRAIHSTLRLDELIHLILSAATVQGGPGFERAMLFMVNERSGILHGMLGVTRDTAPMVLTPDHQLSAWERPEVSDEAREAQRQTAFCRQVVKQRLALDPADNPMALAVHEERVVFVPRPQAESPSFVDMTRALGLAPCACAPLLGRKKVLGVLVVDNPRSETEITPDRQQFLELFANQAAQAMENCLLLHRLEESHRDLRETQERMIQGEKMAALGETAASVTHELRNPLVAIGGFAQRLARISAEGSKEKEYSSIIVREVRRMEEMLGNILAFSRKQMLCINDCRIETVVEEALTLEEDALQRAGITLVCEIAENLPVIRGDEQKLRQVLVNLIGNARQSMPGGGRLTISAYTTFLRGDQAVALEVEDTGGGIPADVMRNIFNPFFTTRESGTGLGLSIVHRIIEHHYGDIEVQNREKGALFIVRLAVDGVPKAHPYR